METPSQTPVLRRFVALGLLVGAVVLSSLGPALASTTDTEPAADGGTTVDILPVDEYLDPPTERAIRAVLDEAEARGDGLVVLQLDHRGVVSVDTEALADRIAEATVPVVVFVRPGSTAPPAVGGTLLLLGAADVRAASPDARLGPLAPLSVGDAITTESQLAAVDALAARWPEAADLLGSQPATTSVFADETSDVLDLVVPELEPLLIELDGVEVETADGPQVLRLRSTEVNVRFHSLGLLGRLLHSATTPSFIYLLLVTGLGMLLFEVFQPGFGVAGVAGIVTLAIAVFGLTVLPVTWWAVALVLLGLGLYAIDTAVAGFGPVTIAATAAFATGSAFFYDSDVIGVNGWLVGLTTLTALGFFVVVMTVVLRAQAGPEDLAVEQLVGRPGIVRSVLNPEGHVYIDGALWRARWTDEDQGRRLKVGKPVRVHGVDGAVLLVESFDPETAAAARADAETTTEAPS